MSVEASAQTNPAELPDSMEEEFELAKAERRQPRCIYCGKPLDRVVEVQSTVIIWTWNAKEKRYYKDDSAGSSDCPQCDRCEQKDWDFTSNDFIDY